MLQRVAFHVLVDDGQTAHFWRGRLTGLLMAYWKKSPSLVAVAINKT